jgi:uncharacterized protein involved in type VI secretion and phage assembly
MGATNRDTRVTGVVTGIVTDVNDPESRGRVKVTFPWLGEDYNSDWARMVQVGAGPDRGASFIPEVNDEVLVAFDHGEFRFPYVLGSLHNGQDKPKLGDGLIDGTSGAVKRRGLISKDGHALIFFDDPSKDGVALMTGDKDLRISLNKSQTTIKITSSGKIVIQGQGDVDVKSDGNLTIEAQGNLTLKGNAVDVEANSTMDLKASATMTVKGAQIMLN